jgi:hypothetical protein
VYYSTRNQLVLFKQIYGLNDPEAEMSKKHLALALCWLAVAEAETKMKKLEAAYAKSMEPKVYEAWKAEFAALLSHCETLIHVGEMSAEVFYKILEAPHVPVPWHPMARPIVSGFGLKGAPKTVFA